MLPDEHTLEVCLKLRLLYNAGERSNTIHIDVRGRRKVRMAALNVDVFAPPWMPTSAHGLGFRESSGSSMGRRFSGSAADPKGF